MARLARMIGEGIAHPITQRGNARRAVFDIDGDRLVYVRLLGQYSILHQRSLAD